MIIFLLRVRKDTASARHGYGHECLGGSCIRPVSERGSRNIPRESSDRWLGKTREGGVGMAESPEPRWDGLRLGQT